MHADCYGICQYISTKIYDVIIRKDSEIKYVSFCSFTRVFILHDPVTAVII